MNAEESSTPSNYLEYASPPELADRPFRALASRTFRIALFCWYYPLLIGLSIFGVWLIFHDALEVLGAVILIIGVLFFAAGVIFLAIYLFDDWRKSKRPAVEVLLPTLLALMLLGSNFLVAGAIINAVDRFEARIAGATAD